MSRQQKKRIVVTGLGVVSCFGNNPHTFYEELLAGKSGISLIEGFPCEDLQTRFAGEIKNFDPGDYIDKKTARRVDKFIAYGIVAGRKALEDAGLTDAAFEALDKTRCGVILGSGIGGMTVFHDNVEACVTRGPSRINPFFIPYTLTNMGGALLAINIGFMGPNYSVSTACATGNYTIAQAANFIRSGEADLIVCGGAEAPIHKIGVGGFNACKALSQRNDNPQAAARPWDKGRDGFVMGEGSGILILESLEHAEARGAKIYAEYLGAGISCDAHHITEPTPDGSGVCLALQKALKDAGIKETDVDYINAHATSTPVGDMAEIGALNKVFSNPEKIVMNGTKSMIGHALGAAGGLEAVATVKAIETGKVHPTLNLDDPEEGLNFVVPKEAIDLDIDVAISNSFGFGGHNATVVFRRFKGNQ